MIPDRTEVTRKIKQAARNLGFTDCGIAPARPLPENAHHLKKWLRLEMNAGMKYMEKHFEKRIDPGVLVPGAKSVIVVALNFFPGTQQTEPSNNLLLSKYVYGRDYHSMLKEKLHKLQKAITEEIITCNARAFVDSAPILEKALAALAGLGWIGKNSALISKKHGSFLFLGELVVDVALAYDNPMPDYCGSCNRCIDACPTRALVAPKILDARKCISYWTIEHQGTIDPSLKEKFGNRIFGCDTCHDVCPWNSKAKPTDLPELQPKPDLIAMTKKDWLGLNKERFIELFNDSSVKRTGFDNLRRNIDFVSDTSE
jgi:epoxyqueuosine reductase